MAYLVVCDGGPNDTTVGFEAKTVGQAFGRAEKMWKALSPTILTIEKITDQRKLDQIPVGSEEEAGHN